MTKISETSKLFSELLGTYLLVFIVGLTLSVGKDDPALAVFGPTSIASALMMLVYAFANISGGHLNPAVTFCIAIKEGKSADKALYAKYMVAQCLGGAVAGLSTGFLYSWAGSGAGASLLQPTQDAFWLGAPLVEFFYTFLLCFVVLNVTYEGGVEGSAKRENHFAGLAIGFVIIAAHGAAAVSGAALNPAVALGINFMGLGWQSFWLPIYAAVQFIGGFAAVVAFHIVRPETKSMHQDIDEIPGKITEISRKIQDKFDPEDTSEFLGTFFIGLTLSLNCMAGANNPGALWSVACCFMVMIMSVGDVSGAVFNPALTLAFCARWWGTGQGFNTNEELQKNPRREPTKLCDPKERTVETIKYLLAQCLGAAAGAGVSMLVYLAIGSWPVPTVGPKKTFTDGQAFFAELLGTFTLCYIVLSIASVKSPLQQFAGITIGSAIVAIGYSFGPISGGLLNPAVTLATAILDKLKAITDPACLLYLLAQFLGGILSAVVFRLVTHPHEIPQDGLGEALKDSEQGASN